MKKFAGYITAGVVGGGAMFGFGEVVIQVQDEPYIEMLTDCQLDVLLENTLISECAETVISIAEYQDTMNQTVHASPELEEFSSIEDPGRLAIVVDSYKEELVQTLEDYKKDNKLQRIGNVIAGLLSGMAMHGLARAYIKNNSNPVPEGPPAKSEEDLSEGNVTF